MMDKPTLPQQLLSDSEYAELESLFNRMLGPAKKLAMLRARSHGKHLDEHGLRAVTSVAKGGIRVGYPKLDYENDYDIGNDYDIEEIEVPREALLFPAQFEMQYRNQIAQNEALRESQQRQMSLGRNLSTALDEHEFVKEWARQHLAKGDAERLAEDLDHRATLARQAIQSR